MKNYLHAFWITAFLLFLCHPILAHDFEVDGIYYNYLSEQDKTIAVEYSLEHYSGDVMIPASVTYEGKTYSVTSIGNSAFNGSTGLTSIEIPNSVTSIGNLAFAGCTGLTSIEIPNSVTSIGNFAFMGCTGLTSIEIPNSVTSIGFSVFNHCIRLENIVVDSDNEVFDSRDNCNAIIWTPRNMLSFGCKNTIIPSSVTSIGFEAFEDCTGLTSIEIPNSVTSIGFRAFSGCTGLTSIEIPNSVTSIEDGAFSLVKNIQYSGSAIGSPWGALTVNGVVDGDYIYADAAMTQLTAYIGCGGDVVVPNRVTTIGNYAFYCCTGLTSIKIPNSVTSIGNYAFFRCTGLTSIEIPNSVTSIGNYAFSDCSGLTSIIVDSDNEVYDSRDNCNAIIETASNTLVSGCMNSIIPSSVTSIGFEAFEDCTGLTSIEIPNSVTSIGNYAFYGCTGLTSIVIPNSVTYIYPNAFNGCANLETLYCNTNEIGASFSNKSSLKRVEIGSSVTAISNSAFLGCTGLTSITIPENVNYICNNAFYGCTNLRTVYNQSSLNIVKGQANKGYVAYYADEVYNKGFMSNVAKGKTYIQSYIGTEPSPTLPWADSIAASAFADCTSLTSVSIPGSVTGIGNNAFQGCTSLKNVTIEDFSSDIAMDACEELDSVNRSTTSYPTIGQIDCDSPFFGKVHNNNYMVLKPIASPQINVLFDIDNVNPDVPYDVYVVTLPLTAYDPSANPVKTIFKVQLSYYDESNNKVSFQRTSALETNATDIDSIKIGTYTFPAGSERFKMQIDGYVNPKYVRIGTATTTLLLDCIILRPHQGVESDISLGNNDDYYSLFSDCPLESLYVGRNLNYENDAPFARQRKLKEVILGEDVTRIGNSAFYGCTNLTSVTVHNPVPVEITANTFTNRFNAKLFVPFGSCAAYSTAPYWKDFGMNGSKVTDATILSVNEQETYSKLVYSRTFNNTKWQALYVPFSIPLDTLTKYGLEVAELNNIHMYDTDEDGSFDKTTLEFLYLKRGATEPNYPYLVKASVTGEVTLTLNDVEVKATEETEIECSSTRKRFKIKGTYAGVSGSVMYNNHYYAMGGGTLVQMLSAEDNLKPQRWYMSIENKDGSPIEHYAPSLRIAIDGIELDEQETGITSIDNEQLIMDNDDAATYNLMGQQVNKTVNGLYIKNHKKMIVR